MEAVTRYESGKMYLFWGVAAAMFLIASAAGPVIMQIYEKLAQMGYIDANATTIKDSAKKTK